jgi:dTDP-4-amino-4,6-dideoxy-D-galactose acyltransferase
MERIAWNPLHFLERLFPTNPTPIGIKTSDFEIKRLDWDSDFFSAEIHKVDFISPRAEKISDRLKESGFPIDSQRWNIFAEVPTEAVHAFRILGEGGFALVETRLTYYHLLENLPAQNQKGRNAENKDIPALRSVASGAVNAFDKYHADPFFGEEETNRYLETYIENCVKGFAERVFVPDLPSEPASFVALSKINDPILSGKGLFYRIPLTACLPANKGWHYPLCLHALWYARSMGAKCLVMTTQSTNKAVIHNCEKLGFKLGSCTHLFSKSSN